MGGDVPPPRHCRSRRRAALFLASLLGLSIVAIGAFGTYSSVTGESATTWDTQSDLSSAVLLGTTANADGTVTLRGRTPQSAEPRSGAFGLLRPLPSNPRYFTADGTSAVYLTGSHNWLNLLDRT